MSNTLFNYFKKSDNNSKVANSPVAQKLVKKESNIKNSSKQIDKENAKPKNDVQKMELDNDNEQDHEQDNEQDIIRPTPKSESKPKRSIEQGKDSARNVKRRRLMVLDSDSDENEENEKKISKTKKKEAESSPDIELDSESESDEEDSFIDDDDLEEEEEEEEEDNKPKSKKRPAAKNKNLSLSAVGSPKTPKTPNTPKTPKGRSTSKSNVNQTPSSATKSSLSSFSANLDSDSIQIEGKFKHLTYEFLQEDKIKDLNGRFKSDPNYDPRTVLVPESFRKTLTPGLRQWWDLKSRNFDVIIFFKVGKFYELYHQDAVIAVKELGLTFMKGDYAHCGFPEIAFSRFADALVSKGYKVGRVEQTETPEMMTERVRGTKQDKTVRREICRITTPGTKTFNVLDGEVSNAFSQYLFSFVEKVSFVHEKKKREFGVCFVDTTVGKIYIGQFEDDRNCSKFRTTLAHYPSAHILYERNNISKEAKMIVDYQNGMKEAISHEKEMYSASTLLRMLSESDYFKENGDNFKWPDEFKIVLSDHDTLGLTAKNDYELAVNAMGGIVWCLKNCLIDTEILSMKNIEIYQPVDNLLTQEVKRAEVKSKFMKQKYMVLDSISLTNLEVFENNFDNSQSGTLYEKLDFCNTQFGKRLLKTWLVNPLCDPELINDRLDAIEDLRALEEQLMNITDQLKSLPDLERLISKIHQLGNVKKNHPESRAIMYENDTYSKKKVEDFTTILNGFTVASKLLASLKAYCGQFKSNMLKTILTIIQENEANKKLGFPYLDDLLEKYKSSFDADLAKKTGKIIPSKGVNEDYDQALSDIKETENELEKYLKMQTKKFNCQINYFGSSRNRYQLEIPENKCKNLPDDFELTSSKKGFKRYWTNELKEMIARLTDAEERREAALRDNMKVIFKNFDNHFNAWNRAVHCLSILDVLVSLTNYVRNSEHEMCRPEIVMLDESSSKQMPFIDIKSGRHPCIGKTFSGDFIPNDIVIGCEDANNNWQRNPLMLVTGPNMGGKSTLMRQVGLIVILAQMGCYVPAESCRLSPVDRIFTRIGANDKILAGESTFFLELSETASILHHASKHSLVLMDELGRGTATFDGTAIAYSVVKELAQNVNCRTLFSTHYHHLVEEFSDKDNVSMGHMQCMVDDDDQSITFLYKFGEGACPKSHGFNAARLADIPDEIIKLGSIKSIEFENFTKKLQLLKKIMHVKRKNEILDLTDKFKELKSEM